MLPGGVPAQAPHGTCPLPESYGATPPALALRQCSLSPLLLRAARSELTMHVSCVHCPRRKSCSTVQAGWNMQSTASCVIMGVFTALPAICLAASVFIPVPWAKPCQERQAMYLSEGHSARTTLLVAWGRLRDVEHRPPCLLLLNLLGNWSLFMVEEGEFLHCTVQGVVHH